MRRAQYAQKSCEHRDWNSQPQAKNIWNSLVGKDSLQGLAKGMQSYQHIHFGFLIFRTIKDKSSCYFKLLSRWSFIMVDLEANTTDSCLWSVAHLGLLDLLSDNVISFFILHICDKTPQRSTDLIVLYDKMYFSTLYS